MSSLALPPESCKVFGAAQLPDALAAGSCARDWLNLDSRNLDSRALASPPGGDARALRE